MVKYEKTTTTKEGVILDGDVKYAIQLSSLNNQFLKLYCAISKQRTTPQTDLNGNVANITSNIHLGYISLENKRQVAEIVDGEDILLHLKKFQEIIETEVVPLLNNIPENNETQTV